MFLLVEFASLEGAKAVADRCVLVRGLFELWAQADDYPALINKLRQVSAPCCAQGHFCSGLWTKCWSYARPPWTDSHLNHKTLSEEAVCFAYMQIHRGLRTLQLSPGFL